MNAYQVGVIVSAGCFLLGFIALSVVAVRTDCSERAVRAVGLWMVACTVVFWVTAVLALMEVVNS